VATEVLRRVDAQYFWVLGGEAPQP
jgi:hypothetical protein